MPDLQDMITRLRMMSLFPDGDQSANSTPLLGTDIISPTDVYKPRTELSGKLTAEIGKMPERQKPSKMRSILGGLSTLSTDNPLEKEKIRDQVTNRGFNREMGDWRNKVDVLMKGATEEDRYNTNQRIMAGLTSKSSIEKEKLKLRSQADAAIRYHQNHLQRPMQEDNDGFAYTVNPDNNQAEYVTDEDGDKVKSAKLPEEYRMVLGLKQKKETIAATGAEARKNIAATGDEARKTEDERQQGRMAIQEYRQNNKDFKFFVVPGGNIVAIDPTQPDSVIDTGVDSGKLSDQDKQEFQLKAIEKRGDESRKNITATGEQTRLTNAAKPSALVKAESAAAEKTRQFTTAQKALNEHPEWSSYIQLTPNGANTFSLTLPSGWTDATKEQNKATFDTIHDLIYGTGKAVKPAAKSGETVYQVIGKDGTVIGTTKKPDQVDKSKYTTKPLEQ